MSTAFLSDTRYRDHLAGVGGHPERPERYDAVIGAITRAGLMTNLIPVASREATDDELLLCHTPTYLRIVRHDIASGAPQLSTGDTDITPNSLNVATRA